MKNFQERLGERLRSLEGSGLRRHPREVAGPQGTHLWADGQRVLCLCSNNYLGLAHHPALTAAVRQALDSDGVGAGASRQISGNMQLHRRAEAELARFTGQGAAALFSSGYACNVGVLQALVDREDVLFSDRLNHASLIDGARLSRAKVVLYDHADPGDLERKLRAHRAEGTAALVVTESLFSMDGDTPPLDAIAELAQRFGAGLLVDEAHALGVLGPEGRGLCAAQGVQPDVIVGTLGKAFGSEGAFAAAALDTVELIRNRARSYVFSTAPSPAVAAAAMASVRLVRDAGGSRAKLREHWRGLRTGLRELGYNVPHGDSPIIPVLTGDPETTMAMSRKLFEQGVFVHGIRPPTVPEGAGRLRVVPMATHGSDDISEALAAFAAVRR